MIILAGGTSGSGKNAIFDELGLPVLISATTREMRENETNGQQYAFLSDEEFDALIEQEAFAEWKQYIGNGKRYGTLKESIEPYIESGEDACSTIEVQGLRELNRLYGLHILSFFVYADKHICEKRMIDRGDSPDKRTERLASWEEEVKAADEYDYVIRNNGDLTLEELREMIRTAIEKHRRIVKEQIDHLKK